MKSKMSVSMKLSERAQKLGESITMALDAQARKMPDVINLTPGEPDFLPPQVVLEATIEAIKNGKTKYTAVRGIESLKQAVAVQYVKRGLDYDPQTEIIITASGKEALSAALFAIINPGEEVVILSPYWTSYPEMVKNCGGVPYYFDIKNLAKIGKVLDVVSAKAIILNSPNNPSGLVLTQEQMDILAKELKYRNIWIISDEIYWQLVFSEAKHLSIANQSSELLAKTIIVDGVSKSHAMTGYRIGFALGPEEIIQAIAKHKSQTTGSSCSISQEAALVALTNKEAMAAVVMMRDTYQSRWHKIILPFAQKMGVVYLEAQGAFYWFFKIPGKNFNCLEFCEQLLVQEKLALVPGIAFGYPGWVRLCFAASENELHEGLKRLDRFLQK